MLQRRGVKVLRLVDNDNGILARPLALDEKVVQRDESLRPRLPCLGDPEILQHVLEELVEGQRGVHDERDRALIVESLTKSVQEGSFSRTHLARQDDEALPLLGAVEELGQRFAMSRTHVKELGIRGRVEGFFGQPVERQIHFTILTRRPAPRARPGARSRWRPHRRGRLR